MRRYQSLKHDARNEDFIRHNAIKYRPPSRLGRRGVLGLPRARSPLRAARQEIARELGVSGGRLLHKWLRNLNYLRNLTARHSRLWNRSVTYTIGRFNPTQVEQEMAHTAQMAAPRQGLCDTRMPRVPCAPRRPHVQLAPDHANGRQEVSDDPWYDTRDAHGLPRGLAEPPALECRPRCLNSAADTVPMALVGRLLSLLGSP